MHADIQRAFKRRLNAGKPLLGTFLKTAAPHATEILREVGFDFVIVDAEHAPFGHGDIDMLMLAARAAGIASLVRVSSADAAGILSALDCGAAGVLVPHVTSAAMLHDVIATCRYRGGVRGFSNSSRAGGYGTLGFRDHIALGDEIVSVLAMIEDREAVDRIDEIFAIEGLDGAFIGRGDFSASIGAATPGDPIIMEMVERIGAAARHHGVPLLAHVGSADDPDVAALRQAGVSAFLVSSDQGLLRQAAARNRALFPAT